MSLRYWFRKKYNLPPTDKRYLQMTDEDIVVEYEMSLASEGKTLKNCFSCKCSTYRDQCPICGKELTGDNTIDSVFARIESGEEVDLEQALRGESWEPV